MQHLSKLGSLHTNDKKSTGDNECTLALKPMDYSYPKQRVPVAPQMDLGPTKSF